MIDQEIYELMDRFGRSGLTGMKLSTQDYTIELSRQAQGEPAQMQNTASQPREMPACTQPAPEPGLTVNAPLVGMFYAKPAPDQEPFVKVGDQVSKGQTLFLLEAMKMMSEVPAPCDLVVEAVLKSDGELCSFGEPVLRYRAV